MYIHWSSVTSLLWSVSSWIWRLSWDDWIWSRNLIKFYWIIFVQLCPRTALQKFSNSLHKSIYTFIPKDKASRDDNSNLNILWDIMKKSWDEPDSKETQSHLVDTRFCDSPGCILHLAQSQLGLAAAAVWPWLISGTENGWMEKVQYCTQLKMCQYCKWPLQSIHHLCCVYW